MKILKITREDSVVQFKHEVQGQEATEERDHKAHEAPLKSFDNALQALTSVVCTIMEVGKAYARGMTIRSLSISYTKKGTRSASIKFGKHLDATDQNHFTSTPVFQFDDPADGEEGKKQCSTPDAQLIATAIAETVRYAKGERQQRLLPLDDDGSQAAAEPQSGDVLDFKTPAPSDDGEGKPKAPKSPAKKKTATKKKAAVKKKTAAK